VWQTVNIGRFHVPQHAAGLDRTLTVRPAGPLVSLLLGSACPGAVLVFSDPLGGLTAVTTNAPSVEYLLNIPSSTSTHYP
jgi:hypothetical protein